MNLTQGPGTILSSTIVYNTASLAGGGIFGLQGGFIGSPPLRNSIVVGNSAPIDEDLGGLVFLVSNLYGDADSILFPLADNGGPTRTHALLPGGPAVDGGDNAGAPTFDQRGDGFARIGNGQIDIGAFEVQSGPPLTLTCPPAVVVPTDPGRCDALIAFSALGSPTVSGEFSGTPIVAFSRSDTLEFDGPYPLGVTTVNWSVTDSVGRNATCGQSVRVEDRTPPTLILNGANPMTVECPGFTDPGATASDTCAGDLTASVSVIGAVNSLVPGTYFLTYTVSDGVNAAADVRTVHVVDTQPPVISLNGDNPLVIERCGTFTDPGATADDFCAGFLPPGIIAVSGSVDVSTVGNYVRRYNVSDPMGNPATEETRTVQVRDTTPPLISCPSPITVTAAAGAFSAIVAFTVNASDGCGPSPTLIATPPSGSVFPWARRL